MRVAGWRHVHPADAPRVAEAMERVLAQPLAHRALRAAACGTARAGWCWTEETITNCLDDPDIRGLVANLRDISEQVGPRRRCGSPRRCTGRLVETAQEGIMADRSRRHAPRSPTSGGPILGRPLDDLYGAEHDRPARPERWESAAGRFEVRVPHPDGRDRHPRGRTAAR